MDAQEAHLYAFPLITGRGQWLPLHNGFASASHLLPASLGEAEEEEGGGRGGVEGQASEKLLVSKPKLAVRVCACAHMSLSYGAAPLVWRQTLVPLSAAKQEDARLRKRNKRSRDLGLNSASQPEKLLRGALPQKRLCPTSNICYALLFSTSLGTSLIVFFSLLI